MKRFFFTALFFLQVVTIFSQSLSTHVNVRSCAFLHPQNGPYIETYLSIAANGLRYINAGDNKFQGGVDVQIVIVDGSQVINFEKYSLKTPVINDTSAINFSLLDQKRLSVPDKTVSVEVTIADINDASNTFTSVQSIQPVATYKISISDIQFVDAFGKSTEQNAFVKNGMELQPYTMNFFPSSANKITFYGEVYNTDKYMFDEQFLINFSIRSASTDIENKSFFQYAKYNRSPVVSFLREFDITELPSGNYNIVVELRNKKNEIIAQKKVFIQRAKTGAVNQYDNIAMVNTGGTFVDDYSGEQLNYFLDIIKPRATANEEKLIESLTPRTDDEMKKKFLYNFWMQRNASNPYSEWLTYLELVKEANQSFATPSKPGYKTDRGRVYLQYGPPYDRVTSVNEPGAYPYEIWFYNTLPDKQTNIGFAFYEPSLVSDDYILMHSNARGELHDPRWKVKLYENVASPQELFDIDNTEVKDELGVHRAIDQYNF